MDQAKDHDAREGSSFDPKETVQINGKQIGLSAYASRMNIQILKAVDFSKLHERGADKQTTVQQICRLCRDEKQVKETLDTIWNKQDKAKGTLARLAAENEKLFEFEKMLSEG